MAGIYKKYFIKDLEDASIKQVQISGIVVGKKFRENQILF